MAITPYLTSRAWLGIGLAFVGLVLTLVAAGLGPRGPANVPRGIGIGVGLGLMIIGGMILGRITPRR
jgi:hypothetical protein